MVNDFSQGSVLLMRFLPAAMVLAPVIWRVGLLPKDVPLWQIAVIVIGSGVPFYYLISLGLTMSKATDAGALAPGTLPLLIAIASFVILGERFSRLRFAGFLLILAGGLMIGLWEALTAWEEGGWRGHLAIVAGVSGWALYTVIFRLSGLDALEGAAVSIGWSVMIVIPVALAMGVSTGDAGWQEVSLIVVIQGILGGALALITFGLSVRLLGPSRTAAFTALTPVMVLCASVLFLGEALSLVKVLGIFVVSVGVFLASGVMEEQRG